MASTILEIEKRSELLDAFSLHGEGGFQISVTEDGKAAIKFDRVPETEYQLPLTDLAFYAGFLPMKGSKLIEKYAKDAGEAK